VFRTITAMLHPARRALYRRTLVRGSRQRASLVYSVYFAKNNTRPALAAKRLHGQAQMISDTFSCGSCYGIQSPDLAAETEPFALMQATITLQANATEEMCLRLADSIHDSIRNRVRDVFNPARVAEIHQ
jgi:hypothetical protein